MTDLQPSTPPPPPPPPPPTNGEPASSAGEGEARSTADGGSAGRVIPPFDPFRMRRQLVVDALLYWFAIALVLGGLFALLSMTEDGGSLLNVIPVVLVLVVWMMMNLSSARVSRELPHLAAQIMSNPDAAEVRLAEHLRRRPLLRWVRLMLYHRLAVLRHRQRRFTETAAICHAVLHYRMGPAREARTHVLLLLSEAALEMRDLSSAFLALNELHRLRLSLVEALQRLALQTRYELEAGYDEVVLQRQAQKVQMAELMPAAQCAAMHAMLATAAERTEASSLALSLWARTELLATPEQYQRFQRGEFGVEIVDAVPPTDETHDLAVPEDGT